MSSAAPSTESRSKAKSKRGSRRDFDPDTYRMSIGEHLEELRRRMIRGLLGFVAITFICMCFGKKVVYFFCLPLIHSLAHNKLSPQIYFSGVEESFTVYVKISLITGAAISAPWVVYQIWQFVAAGLYPHERQYVTRYIPVSLALLIIGMVFMYVLVLPLTLNFFLAFNIDFPDAKVDRPIAATTQASLPLNVPVLGQDPPHPSDYQLWFNADDQRLKFFYDGSIRVIPFGSTTMTTPMITLPNYIDMVVNLLMAFGLAFQLPLVVMVLARVGIVNIETLRKSRKYVYFSMSIVAAMIIPDVVSGMIALMVPLIGLYELGILMAVWGENRRKAAEAAEGT